MQLSVIGKFQSVSHSIDLSDASRSTPHNIQVTETKGMFPVGKIKIVVKLQQIAFNINTHAHIYRREARGSKGVRRNCDTRNGMVQRMQQCNRLHNNNATV